jgi:3-hydroxyisobutyrate dehydrogenase-like beta-hydroxyacid dehydrogenase
MFSALAGLHEALALTSENGVADAAALAAFAVGTADTWVGRNWGFFDGIAADYSSAGVPLADRPWSKDLGEVLDAARASGLYLPFASLLAQTIAPTIETHAAAARMQKGHDA